MKAAIFLFLLMCLNAFSAERPEKVSFQVLKERIETSELRTVEELLASLPAVFRERYALMFRSRSVQEASIRDPRVILFGQDARFILTFNGDPTQKGHDSIETMEFDETAKTFNFREIRFSPKPQVSDINPPRCLKCHGSPARPVWDTYPSWPGAYWEVHGKNLSQIEKDGLKSFADSLGSHPRYRFLGKGPLSSSANFLSNARNKYDGTVELSPTAELSRLLSDLNRRAILGQLEKSRLFELYKPLLLASLDENCASLGVMRWDDVVTEPQTYTEFAKRSDQLSQTQEQLKRTRLLVPESISESRTFLSDQRGGSAATRFRYLVEMKLGISTVEWTLALEKNTFDFSTPGLGLGELEPALVELTSHGDPDLRELYRIRDSSNQYCSHLRKKFRMKSAELSGSARNPATFHIERAPETRVTQLIRNCTSCHSEVGIFLPLDQPEALRKILQRTGYPQGTLIKEILFRLSPEAGSARMPRGVNLSDPDRQDLENYFKALSQ